MEFPIDTFALVLAACAVVAALTLRLRQSVIVGYFLAGALIGPHGLGWVADEKTIEPLGNVGVVFLLFLLGTELSIERLRPLLRPALIGGTLQLLLTIAGGVGLAALFGWGWEGGAYFGCIVALSSTAIVVKLLTASGELRAPQGKFALGVLLYQDIAVVPLMILLPALASSPGTVGGSLLGAAGRAAGFLALSFAAGRWLFPLLLRRAARTRSQELFTLTVLALALGTAVAGNRFGLSLAMGAFVAGMTLAQSSFGFKILADVLPFRDAFLSLFFVSIGMLLDWRAAVDDAFLVTSLVVLIIILKVGVSAGVGVLLGLPRGMAIHAGLALAQVGEFSFLLARMGHDARVVDDRIYAAILESAVVTMALTPWLARLGTAAARWKPGGGAARSGPVRPETAGSGEESPAFRDHVIICGFGPVGRLVAESLEAAGLPFVILELNPETVEKARREGVPVVYGDARSEVLLDRAGIERARALVVALPGSDIAEAIVRNVRLRAPSLPIYARAVFLPHVSRLDEAGATVTVHDEREAGRAIVRAIFERIGIKTVDS